MDSTNFNQILQNTLSNIDEIKENLDSEKYLQISNDLNSLYKLLDNNFYEIKYITQHFTRSGMNQFTAIPKIKKEIIKLTTEEYTELEEKLCEDNFCTCSCNMILSGIKERLSKQTYSELVGIFQPNCLEDEDSLSDIFDKSFEMTIYHAIAIVGCRKL